MNDTINRYNAPWSKRKRTVNKNRLVVDELSKLLPENRDALSGLTIQRLCKETGYSSQLIFRKYLRYWLDQRPLSQAAVYDIMLLRDACDLDEKNLVETISENITRAYKRTGVVLNDSIVEGMTSEGAKRKIVGKNNLGKLLYLIESSGLVNDLNSINTLRDDLVDKAGVETSDLNKFRMNLEQ